VVDDGPAQFRRAVKALRTAVVRPEVVLTEAPAPQRIAPYAAAVGADVVVGGEELATGRLVLLHDPAGQDAWAGTFRVVTFIRAGLEPEIAADPLLSGVGWTWLLEALEARSALFTEASGTVTRVASESFGALADRPCEAEVEIRASWTPIGRTPIGRTPIGRTPIGRTPIGANPNGAKPSGTDLGDRVHDHLAAWCELLCTTAGLPPVPPGVIALAARRGPRRG
jgi:hypothetical protein